MAEEINHGGDAGDAGLLADIKLEVDAFKNLPYVRGVLHDYAKATDPDDGGFDTGHTKDSAEALHKWLGRKHVTAKREALHVKHRVKTEIGKMEQRLEGTQEPPARKTVAENAPAKQPKETAPEIKAETKPAPSATPETEGSFRKWMRKKTAEVQRRLKEEAANTRRRLTASDSQNASAPKNDAAVETPKTPAAELTATEQKPQAVAENKTPATQAAPEVKPEVKTDVKAPEVKAPEIKAPEITHAPASSCAAGEPGAHGHGPCVSPEMKAALATAAALELASPHADGGKGKGTGKSKSSLFAKGQVGKYGTAGLSAYGVINGYKDLQKSIAEGDQIGVTLHSASLTSSIGDLTLNGAKTFMKAEKVFKYVKFLDKANVILNIADIGYETYREKGNFIDTDPDGHKVMGHKSQRLAASTSTAVSGSLGFALGSALAGTAGAGAIATLSAVVLPAAGAIAAAYVVNTAANTIIDTERTYEDVDKCFRPDQTRHANLVGAMARVLGNDAANKSLVEAGVKTDPETGRVTMETLNAALADPQEGKYAMGRFKALIGNIRDQDRQVKEPHMPRFIQFTDAQAQARVDYENAKMDARSMESAITEADGYVTDLKKKRAEAAAKAQADLDASLKPFNALPPEIQEDIVNKMKRDYPAYKQQAGDKALDEAGYVMAGKITAASNKELVEAYAKLEAELKPMVQYVAGKELAEWQKQHPAASAADIEAERKQLAAHMRHEAIASPGAFQDKIDRYRAAGQDTRPAIFIPLADPKPASGTLFVRAQEKPATTAPRSMPAPA